MGALSLALHDAPVSTFDFDSWSVAKAPPGRRPTEHDLEHLADAKHALLERAHHVGLELPAFPAVAAQILNLVESPDCDMTKLIKTIKQDPIVSGQVLRTANSVAFSRGVPLTNLHDAAVRLGFKTIGNIAVAAATVSLLREHEREVHDCFRERWGALSASFPRIATASRWLSRAFHRGDAEEAYLAGLMHDLGKVVALELCGEMVQDGDLASNAHPGMVERLLEDTHVELGTLLVKEWMLPWPIAFVCMKHHEKNPEPAKVHDVLHVVRIASSLDAGRHDPWCGPEVRDELLWSAAALDLRLGPFTAVAEELAQLKDDED